MSIIKMTTCVALLMNSLVILFAAFSLNLLVSTTLEAAIGDGRTVYGTATGTPNAPKTRDYTVSSGNWGSQSDLTVIDSGCCKYITIKASPHVDEYIAGVVSSTGPALYVYTYSGGSWAASWNVSVPSVDWQVFDIEYEQNSGDAIVVYTNGGTSNELSYRKRVDGTWDSSSTTFESARTTGVVRFVELEPRPSSDELALAFSDANADLSAFIWDGSAWGSEHTAALSTALDLATARSFDVAYEQVSGDVLIAYSISNGAGAGLAVKLAGETTWVNTTDEGVLADQSTFIDLASEPGTNYIAFSSTSDAVEDLQLAIWDGTDTAPFNFQDTRINADTAVLADAVPSQPVANGWAGTDTNRRAVFAYRDVGATTLSYFTWKKDTAAWEQTENEPAISPAMGNAGKRFIFNYHDPQFSSNGKLWVTIVDGNADFWTLNFDGAAVATTNWVIVDDGTAGDNAVNNDLSTATNKSAGAAWTSFDPTLIDLLGFQAELRAEQAIITWATGSELRVRGFRLYRTFLPQATDSYEELTEKIIPALGNPFSGRQYQYIDKNPLSGIYYILEEVLKDEQTKRYGPIRLDDRMTFIGEELSGSAKPFFRRDGRLELNGKVLPQEAKPFTHSKGKRHFLKNTNPLKIEVEQEGLYRITTQDLINAGWVLINIDPRRLAMFEQGKEIPIYVSGEEDRRLDETDYIEFYGMPTNSTRYTKTNIYYLRLSPQQGLRMGEVHPVQEFFPIKTAYLQDTRSEENASYYQEFKAEEHWFFPEEFISPYRADFKINLDHIIQGKALINIRFQGGSQMGFGANYTQQQAIIYLNDTLLGEANWSKDTGFIFSQEIPLGLLLEGENKLTIEAPDKGGNLQQFFLLDWFELVYLRELFAEEDRLVFDAGDNENSASFKIRGFSSPDIKGFAIAHKDVLYLNNLRVEQETAGDYSVVFSDSKPANKRYIILTQDAIKGPFDIYPDVPSSLKRRNNQADYIVITHSNFINAIKPLVNLRRSRGLKVEVVDVQDIYDEFNFGIFSPLAIKDFLKYTHYYWRRPQPTFVLLVGDGTFDYQDFWQLNQENLVPVYLVHSPDFGETVSDNELVDFDGDKLPEMFIGRLPVKDESQLNSVIDKILTYENMGPNANWTKELLFVADDERQFEDASDSLTALVPSDEHIEKLYLSKSTPEQTRQAIIDELNQGKFIFNYAGHAGVSLLSSSRIFQNSDVQFLNNNSGFPVFLTLSCLTGYFIYPEGMDALSEVMLTAAQKGAIAGVTSSGLSSIPEQKIFFEGFYKAMFEQKLSTLGAIHFKAKRYLYEQRSLIGSDNKIDNIIQTYNLLGDPALILRREGATSGYPISLFQDMLKE